VIMKLNKISIIVVSVVFLVTAILIVLHLIYDEVNIGNAVTLEYGEKQVIVPLKKLNEQEFTGTLTNAKGEKTESTFNGVELRVLLETEEFDLSKVKYAKVIAQDQYSAEVLADEIREPGKVFIATKRNGETLPGLQSGTEGAQLIIFGDSDSKRCVRYLEAVVLYSDGN